MLNEAVTDRRRRPQFAIAYIMRLRFAAPATAHGWLTVPKAGAVA